MYIYDLRNSNVKNDPIVLKLKSTAFKTTNISKSVEAREGLGDNLKLCATRSERVVNNQ